MHIYTNATVGKYWQGKSLLLKWAKFRMSGFFSLGYAIF